MASYPKADNQSRVIDVEKLADGQYVGQCHGSRNADRAYGGSLLAQSIGAAYQDMPPDRRLHSLHAYFMRPIEPDKPVTYSPLTIREGRSFTVARVEAEQHGKSVSTMMTSFKRPHLGSYARPPALTAKPPGPADLPDAFANRPAGSPLRLNVECRETRAVVTQEEIRRDLWIRLKHRLGDRRADHVAAIAYLSDFGLAPTALLHIDGQLPAHGFVSSLDHAMWFHSEARADEWLLYRLSSRVQSDSCAFGRGEIWTSDGTLVASVAQEALVLLTD